MAVVILAHKSSSDHQLILNEMETATPQRFSFYSLLCVRKFSSPAMFPWFTLPWQPNKALMGKMTYCHGIIWGKGQIPHNRGKEV